jgi:SAM-dependent methyltransferase
MSSHAKYALGYTNAEQERLIRQAFRIAPTTERLFREAGVGDGQRVLDLGSGMGDVSMLVARLVGPTGEVVGIERNADSIARARARVDAAGFRNISFLQSELGDLAVGERFDAVVGRFILMFLPDPRSVLQLVAALVRPGGVIAFQETSWLTTFAIGARLPLWSKLLSAIRETLIRSGANPEMGLDLHRVFPEAGLPVPHMHMEAPLGSDADFTGLLSHLIISLRPQAEQHGVSLDVLGDLGSLPARIQTEVAASNSVVSFVSLVGAWAHKPA